MKERPILFSAPMVRAILDGRKTQTRRVVKPQPYALERGPGRGLPFATYEPYYHGIEAKRLNCPYGVQGDLLWVRETFGLHPKFAQFAFRADAEEFEDADGWLWKPTWKPSIHMPRAFSRITLEVVTVRVERLHFITEEDAKAEGVTPSDTVLKVAHLPYVESFIELWDSINGGRYGHCWDSNPWVWVIEFRRVQP